jgi:cytochrome c553
MRAVHGVFSAAVSYCLLLGASPLAAQYRLDQQDQLPADSIDLCMTCHGSYGQGNPVVGGPSLAGMESWYLEKQLLDFRAGVRGNHPDYIPGFEMHATAMALGDAQIAAIVQTVAAWEPGPPTFTVAGDATKGQDLYQSCAACHGNSAEGNQTVGAPALAGRSDWYLLQQMALYQSGLRGNDASRDPTGAVMKAAAEMITSDQLPDLVAYINSMARSSQ